jgi:hypothetical protein
LMWFSLFLFSTRQTSKKSRSWTSCTTWWTWWMHLKKGFALAVSMFFPI